LLSAFLVALRCIFNPVDRGRKARERTDDGRQRDGQEDTRIVLRRRRRNEDGAKEIVIDSVAKKELH